MMSSAEQCENVIKDWLWYQQVTLLWVDNTVFNKGFCNNQSPSAKRVTHWITHWFTHW